MCELLRQQAAPEGNSMDIHYFMTVFKEVAKIKVADPRGRLTCLIKFTKGEAKEIAKNCIQLPSEAGFKTAKQLLTERFEDPHIITASYRKEIKQWPQIKTSDADSYKGFQNFLLNIKILTICRVGMC